MPRRKVKLTEEIRKKILAGIRSGGYPWVAAEAAGVPVEVFDQWMAWGIGGRQGHKLYMDFAGEVRQAQAQARLMVEIEVRRNDPKFWLRNGPGKENQSSPGWSMPPKPNVTVDNRTLNVLASPEWSSLWASITQALEAFPEARVALAETLKALPPPK